MTAFLRYHQPPTVTFTLNQYSRWAQSETLHQPRPAARARRGDCLVSRLPGHSSVAATARRCRGDRPDGRSHREEPFEQAIPPAMNGTEAVRVLDTTTVSALMKGDHRAVERLATLERSGVVLPQPVVAEIRFGLERLPRSRRKARLDAGQSGRRRRASLPAGTRHVRAGVAVPGTEPAAAAEPRRRDPNRQTRLHFEASAP